LEAYDQELGVSHVTMPQLSDFLPCHDYGEIDFTIEKEDKQMKIFGIYIGWGVGILIGIFMLSLVGVGYYSFFAPMVKNVEREVFENTKSYIQGVQQDLGKYYLEYQKGTQSEKGAIRATIQMRFAEVDSSKLQSPQLRAFLTQTRGY